VRIPPATPTKALATQLDRCAERKVFLLNGNERGALSNEFQEDVLATLLLAETPYIPREERESFRNH
jgi:hypothetical protein